MKEVRVAKKCLAVSPSRPGTWCVIGAGTTAEIGPCDLFAVFAPDHVALIVHNNEMWLVPQHCLTDLEGFPVRG
jgi:hypothetical protein